MTDYKYNVHHCILPDGTLVLAGAEAPYYVNQGVDENKLPEGAEMVSLGCDWVRVSKDNTIKRIVNAIKWIEKKYPETKGLFGIYENPDNETGSISNNRWLDNQGWTQCARDINNELYNIVYNNAPSIIKKEVV